MMNLVDIQLLLISFICGFSGLCVIIYNGTVERLSMFFIGLFCSYIGMNYKRWNLKYLSLMVSSLLFGFFIAGWITISMESRSISKPYPQDFKGENQTAVLLILRGEEERYDAAALLEKMEKDRRLFNRLYSIAMLYQYKRAYEQVGISRYTDKSREIYDKLGKLLDVNYDVYLSYLDGDTSYKRVLENKFAGRSYEKIIIVPVVLSESSAYLNLIHDLNQYSLKVTNSHIKFAQPLWNSEKLTRGIVLQVDAHAEGYENANMGIILMSSTKVEKRNEEKSAAGLKQEMLFLENLKRQLVRVGYEDRKIKLAAAYLPASSIKNSIEELQQYGVREICIITVNDVVDDVRNIAHTEKIIKRLKDEVEFDIQYIQGWGASDQLIEEIENRVRLLNVEE
ncbi:hypothetical protein SAMN02745975_01388 [Geosporobacter subterraneus DSM 17957]|uniref:Ferrochelatase n=1 Tax=Geosporobacter subterraneus DSM 17957 TaxID=1121919 RepID=A0A1M6GX53_9FIRM|nr:hypothetical protein [Geosporobacter subterraneus]SHJ14502.1 hypothetical protein SAMN02745975_01388 [Geosporobacter subterraneus DSM 17957]